MPKDRFSKQAKEYSLYRPVYPSSVYRQIFGHVAGREKAWDCATGNGQVAGVLAEFFERVCATDISQNQLDHAVVRENIEYRVSAAEETPFPDHHFDLVTVAQALHWFDLSMFFRELDRVLKPGGIFATWGYGIIRFEDQKINEVIDWFYEDITGPYWDFERRLVDEAYAQIAFPYPLLQHQPFKIPVRYNTHDLLNFFSSWSSVKNYEQQHNRDPVKLVAEKLATGSKGDPKKEAWFPGFIFISKKPEA